MNDGSKIMLWIVIRGILFREEEEGKYIRLD